MYVCSSGHRVHRVDGAVREWGGHGGCRGIGLEPGEKLGGDLARGRSECGGGDDGAGDASLPLEVEHQRVVCGGIHSAKG